MNTMTIKSDDNHEFSAFRAEPAEKARHAVIVLHEILGVTPYIQRVCERFAAAGYLAVAPALFDRIERGAALSMSDEDIAHGRELRARVGWDLPLKDIAAVCSALSAEVETVSIVGFCWGGVLAWRAARLDGVCAVVCYYGGQIPQFLHEAPRAPVLLHFGEKDPVLPSEAVQQILAAYPDVPFFNYPAGHAFDNDQRADHDAASSRLAHQRTLEFLAARCG